MTHRKASPPNTTRCEHGFTLIELMVVVLVIAILVAIALPTFLGARTRAADRAGQADIRTAYAAALVAYTEREDFAEADAVSLAPTETSIRFIDAGIPSTGTPMTVSVAVGNVMGADRQIWGAARLSTSATCFYLTMIGHGIAQGTYRNSVDTSGGGASCTGNEALAFTTGDGTW
jgi:prepilin-type N-terminal cleavage/methylation domain-containing protein